MSNNVPLFCTDLNSWTRINVYDTVGKGESLSPFLYAMYVNDIEIELIKQGCQSYELKMFNLYLLMYADDTVLG
jgi:hypothetical protein